MRIILLFIFLFGCDPKHIVMDTPTDCGPMPGCPCKLAYPCSVGLGCPCPDWPLDVVIPEARGK